MNKQRPSTLALVTMIGFTASCIGLLMFLWISFGGSLPLASQGYRINVEFNQAVELAPQSQVMISGVEVGHVVGTELDHSTGLTRATLEIDRQFAPRPADTRAVLRAKTLLGETYVELSAGTPTAPKLPDGGTIPHSNVAPTVQLDQIFSALDPKTRKAFQTWMIQGGIALTGRGEQFNQAFAALYPFATNVDRVLAVLRRDSASTSTLLRDGGVVFSALSRSPSALQGFVTNSNRVFAATAARNQALAATIKAFPAYLAQTKSTLDRVNRFALNTQPLINELIPVAQQLNPVLFSTEKLAPELRNLLVYVAPLTKASKAGFPALSGFLNDSIPFLVRAKPYLGGVVPVLNYINDYRAEIAAFFANSTATTQGILPSLGPGGARHYVRISNPINPEALAVYANRPYSNRSNPYLVPKGYLRLQTGLQTFGSYLCTNNPLPGIGPSLSNSTTTVEGTVLTLAQLVQQFYYTATPGGPPCAGQPPLGSVTTGQAQSFPRLQPLP